MLDPAAGKQIAGRGKTSKRSLGCVQHNSQQVKRWWKVPFLLVLHQPILNLTPNRLICRSGQRYIVIRTAGWTRGGEKSVPLHEVMSYKVKSLSISIQHYLLHFSYLPSFLLPMFPRDVGTLRHVLLQIFVFAFVLFICSSKSCVLCIAIVAVQLCLCISASQPIFSVTFSVNFDCLLVFCLLRELQGFRELHWSIESYFKRLLCSLSFFCRLVVVHHSYC